MQPFNGKPGVLVADDEHMVRIIVQLALERSGFDVWAACNGQDAVQMYRAHMDCIVLALLDVHMPGLDGPRTLDALRELNPEICACFMSGDLGDYDAEDLIRRGAERVIAKPFRVGELVAVVHGLAPEISEFAHDGHAGA